MDLCFCNPRTRPAPSWRHPELSPTMKMVLQFLRIDKVVPLRSSVTKIECFISRLRISQWMCTLRQCKLIKNPCFHLESHSSERAVWVPLIYDPMLLLWIFLSAAIRTKSRRRTVWMNRSNLRPPTLYPHLIFLLTHLIILLTLCIIGSYPPSSRFFPESFIIVWFVYDQKLHNHQPLRFPFSYHWIYRSSSLQLFFIIISIVYLKRIGTRKENYRSMAGAERLLETILFIH